MRQERLFSLSPILFIVILLFSGFQTKRADITWFGIYDTFGILVISTILFLYFIAFPKLTQNTPNELLTYKIHWLQSMSILLGLFGLTLNLMFGIKYILYMKESDGHLILNQLSLTFGVSLISIIYGLILAFCFYILKIFIKSYDRNDGELTFYNNKKIKTINIISLFWMFLIFNLLIVIASFGSYKVVNIFSSTFTKGLIVSGHIYLFPLLLLLFIFLYKEKSLKNIIYNYIGDYYDDEKLESQLKFILTLKKFIMRFIFLLLLMLPIWELYAIGWYISPERQESLPNFGYFYGYLIITFIFIIGLFILIMLSVIEAKYSQRLYMINNRLIYDKYFIHKYVAIPACIWLLYTAIFWILSMVLI